MRVFIAAVLVVLFVAVMASESDKRFASWIKQGLEQANPEKVDKIKKGFKKFQSIRNALKNKSVEQSDAKFFKKIGKLVKKVAPLVKKGFEIYGKVKGMGILSEQAVAPKSRKPRQPRSGKPASRKPRSGKPASRKPRQPKSGKPASRKPRSQKPKSRKPRSGKPTGSRKPKSGKPASRKPRQPKSGKPAARKQKKAQTEADLFIGALAGLAAKKLIAKKVGGLIKNKLSKKGKGKKAESESDAEFLNKLKNWWTTKGKGIFEKAKGFYAKGKQIYDIVKPKKAAEAEAEADTEATINCGMAYQSGTALGNKQCVTVQGKPVVVETAIAFEKLNAAAKAAGITLQVNSGFRTQAEQEHLYKCYQTKKCNNGNLAARPGYSNHQNGKAMDISCSNPKVFDWMRNNASKYGFVRTVASENWHWENRPGDKCNKHVSYTCK